MSSVEERFWAKVDKRGPDECWEWGASRSSSGYGLFWAGSRLVAAHRFSWSLVHGSVPGRLLICHHCDNRGCVNPNHLFLGTQRDNAQDRDRKGRREAPAGGRNGQAKLAKEQVLGVRREYQRGDVYQRELAAKYGVSQCQISKIVLGQCWKHVEEGL